MNMIQYGIDPTNNSCLLSVSHAEMPTKYQDLVGVTFVSMGWLFNIHYQSWLLIPHAFTYIPVQHWSRNSQRAYDMMLGEAVCGSPTPLDCALSCTWGNKSRGLLVTTGVLKINVWTVNDATRKLLPSSCDVGRKKRTNQCVVRVSTLDNAIGIT
jgi:hypothetical protein